MACSRYNLSIAFIIFCASFRPLLVNHGREEADEGRMGLGHSSQLGTGGWGQPGLQGGGKEVSMDVGRAGHARAKAGEQAKAFG